MVPDPSQTTPVQITHDFALCCSTRIGRVEQHNAKTCVICTVVVWLSSPAVIALSVLRAQANEAICKLPAWNVHKSTININLPRRSDNSQ